MVVGPYALVSVLHTLGWRLAFPGRAPSLVRLGAIRLGGEAFNVAAASVGGEPVKVMLLRPGVPTADAVAAVVIDKTTITLAQGLFLGAGLIVAHAGFALPPGFLTLMTWLLAIEVVAVGGFALVQGFEVVGRGLHALARPRWPGLARRIEPLLQVERLLGAFYRRDPTRLALALGWHLLGWAAGALEVYLVLRLLGLEVSLGAALVVEAFSTAVRFVAFMVPATLGALEAGTMVAFQALGWGAGLGLAVSLIRRVRQVAWVALGLACLAALRHPLAPDG